jgi:outer membrane protein OmpA-like peptidoglycan-associated protein
MENQFTTARAALALLLASNLGACTTAQTATPTGASSLKPAQLAITQAGFAPTARYVYCEEVACPVPTMKTPVPTVAQLPIVAQVFQPKRLLSLELSFPFNSSRMSAGDKKLLAEAASSYAGGDIEITARSDFIGPTAGQMKVVDARAKAMRSIVAKQTQDARIVERREVAGPNPVAKTEQAQQRRGSVRFTHPIDVQLKGTPK